MTVLRLLAEGANARGDQFTRVVSAYFATLGYSGFRFNVHKAGRELDLQGSHAFEPRLLRAECKATATPIGGADLNKFFGVLERERSSNLEAEIQGYFVSLSGFTETAIEQEAPSPRFIVVNGEEIVAQIIAGRVVASEDVSVAQAAALMKDVRPTASFVPGGSEILVGDSGWYWLVRFQDGIEPLATVLSADGSELFGEQIDEEERQGIEAAAGVTLCLRSAPTRGIDVEDSKRQHLEALSTRCGSITLDGLPTDEGLGGRTFRLEDAYVELQLAPAKGARSAVRMVKARQLGGEESPGEDAVGDPGDALPLGPVLQSFSRVAVLGPPGAGKSTLLKRIALAHSGRGGLAVDDGYEADTRLVVVYMKCRLLEAPSMGVIEMILDAMDPEGVSNRDAMLQLLANALTGDGVLLLVDGLDEIADERHRAAFAASLQSFLLGHPKVRCVVTSREAGFRLVAGPITTVCEPFSLRPLSDRAITDLVERWFHLTIGESEESKALSRRVNEEIRLSLPVRRLATNPLLLTALLLVRRWAGSLPPQRTVLYDRAIDVLVNTWNVEGHTPMRSDETIPQLAFVAYRMLESGQQGVSLPTLQDHVTSVRKALPELLGFVGTSPAEFVERVEERSSLLSLTGHTTSEGRVVPVYEFKHLTFQEYLAAVAIAFDYGVVPDGLDITGEVRRNLDDDRWTETLSLLAVLSGRRASQVVDVMCDGLRKSTTRLDEHDPAKHAASARLTGMLLRAFEDGVKLRREDAARAIQTLLESSRTSSLRSSGLQGLVASQYADLTSEIVEDQWRRSRSAENTLLWGGASGLWMSSRAQFGIDDETAVVSDLTDRVVASRDHAEREHSTLAIMDLAYTCAIERRPLGALGGASLGRGLLEMMRSARQKSVFSACWAAAWMCQAGWSPRGQLLEELNDAAFSAWTEVLKGELRTFGAWAFAELPWPRSPDEMRARDTWGRAEFVERERKRAFGPDRSPRNMGVAFLKAHVLLGGPMTQDEMELLASELPPTVNGRAGRRLQRRLRQG